MKNSKLTILYILPTFQRGGAETLLLQMVRYFVAQGHQVLVIALVRGGEMQKAFEQTGACVEVLNKKTKLGLGIILRLIQYMKNVRPDVVHTHLFGADVWGGLAAKIMRVPVLLSTEHNINFYEGKVRMYVKRIILKCFDGVIVISQAVGRHAKDAYKVSRSHIFTIYNGVDLSQYSYRKDYQYFSDGVRMCIVARLHEQKGHTYLLDALSRLKAQYPRIGLDIYGSGPLEAKLRVHAKKAGVSELVTFKGTQPITDTLLHQYDLFVLPSVWEGLGIAVLEAQASGVPVIVSDVDGLSELVTDKKTGISVEAKNPAALAEGIRWAITHSSKLSQITAAARRQVEHTYSLDEMLKKYETLYKKLCKKN